MNDRHVLVLGLGQSGLAMARWCARHGATVTVADTREAPPQRAALHESVPAATAAVVDEARRRGLPIHGELGLFAQALKGLREERDYAPTVLAITGTNGKTTVTSLTGQLVERAGKTVIVAGNIGPSLLGTLQQALDDDALPEV